MAAQVALPAIEIIFSPALGIKEAGDAGECLRSAPGLWACLLVLMNLALIDLYIYAAYERRDYRTANECYGRALQIDPNLIPALLNRSLTALHTGAV